MASIPTHLVVGAALGQAASQRLRADWRFWAAAMACSAVPDIDVIGFGFGICYGDLWGHRGMTHSILFAAVIALVVGISFGGSWVERIGQSFLFFLITVSHGFLDAMTNGGLGIAFFSPFDPTRYFLPWRPILVSPIGKARFLSERGFAVIASELIYVWLPAVVLAVVVICLRRFRQSATESWQ